MSRTCSSRNKGLQNTHYRDTKQLCGMTHAYERAARPAISGEDVMLIAMSQRQHADHACDRRLAGSGLRAPSAPPPDNYGTTTFPGKQ